VEATQRLVGVEVGREAQLRTCPPRGAEDVGADDVQRGLAVLGGEDEARQPDARTPRPRPRREVRVGPGALYLVGRLAVAVGGAVQEQVRAGRRGVLRAAGAEDA